MNISSILVAVPLLLLTSSPATLQASQVITLGWAKFHVEAGGIELLGTQNDAGITSLKIKVFGKKYALTKGQLSELAGFSANGLRIYNEGGYQGLGGETYYIHFFTESEPDKRISKTVSISQENGVKIESGRLK